MSALTDTRVPAAVLATDIVSFSREYDEAQVRLVAKLGDLTNQILDSLGIRDAILLPTGDGLYTVFPGRTSAAALEVADALHAAMRSGLHAIPVRMGIHEGALALVKDVNGSSNVVGSAVNIAQRVMDIGDAGHVLLSDVAAATALASEEHQPYVKPVAAHPVEVKHGLRLSVFQYVKDGVGRPDIPGKISGDIGIRASAIGRGTDWRELLNTTERLRMIDYSMPLIGTPALLDEMEALVRSGARIQLLILNPLSALHEVRRESRAYDSEQELETTIQYVVQILIGFRERLVKKLGEETASRFEVRLFDAVPGISASLTDSVGHISFYVEHLSGARGPFLTVAKPSLLYSCVADAFETIWNERSLALFEPGRAERLQELLEKRQRQAGELRVPHYLM